MFEQRMKMFRVRCTRDGEDAGTFVLHAVDVDDAVARAKGIAAQEEDSPFDNPVGLEVWVAEFLR